MAARVSVEAPALATAAEGPGLLVGRAASTLVLEGAPGSPSEGAAAVAAGSLRLALVAEAGWAAKAEQPSGGSPSHLLSPECRGPPVAEGYTPAADGCPRDNFLAISPPVNSLAPLLPEHLGSHRDRRSRRRPLIPRRCPIQTRHNLQLTPDRSCRHLAECPWSESAGWDGAEPDLNLRPPENQLLQKPEHRLAQLPNLLCSWATQAEKTQAEKHQAPAQLGPSGTGSLLYTTEGLVLGVPLSICSFPPLVHESWAGREEGGLQGIGPLLRP